LLYFIIFGVEFQNPGKGTRRLRGYIAAILRQHTTRIVPERKGIHIVLLGDILLCREVLEVLKGMNRGENPVLQWNDVIHVKPLGASRIELPDRRCVGPFRGFGNLFRSPFG
jgi:hypothetical protein